MMWKWLAVVGLVLSHFALFALGVTIANNPDAEFHLGYGELRARVVKSGQQKELEDERRRSATAEAEAKREAAMRLGAERQRGRSERLAELCRGSLAEAKKDSQSCQRTSDQLREQATALATRNRLLKEQLAEAEQSAHSGEDGHLFRCMATTCSDR